MNSKKTIFNTISNPQYLLLLQRCSTMDQLKQIHAQTITIGLARFTFVTSKLLAFSAIFDIHHAHTIFNRIPTPTIFDYNSIISAYSKAPNQEMGFLLYTRMRNNGIPPNSRTFPVLIKSCSCKASLRQVHGQIVKNGNLYDVYLTSSLISMYSGFKGFEFAKRVLEESPFKTNVVCCTSLITGCFSNGLVDYARKVFDEMPERNDVTYSAMITGFVRNELFNEAIELFRGFTDFGLAKPNRSLLLSVLNACGAIGALDVGKNIHSRLVEDPFGFDVDLGTALIDFYAKCGDIDTAHDIFNRMGRKDVATWSAMVLGLATNGKNQMAIKLFEEMEQKGPIPNGITFVSVLVACNHKTLAKKAWWFLGKMIKVYSLQPGIEHYGCMVDLLTRFGELKGAQILIKLMPMAPDGAIWGSFLHGCLLHSETRLAESVGKQLIDLEPRHGGRYVTIANMYAEMGSWDGVIRLRDMMVERKVANVPGWSFVEVDGVVHKFFVDDRCHPRARDLRVVLQVLNKASIS